MKKKSIPVLIFGTLFHLFGYVVLAFKIEPFQYFAYLIFWWSYIMIIDSLLALRTQRFLILTSRLPFLILFSSGFWCIFELANLRLANWFYVNLPPRGIQRWMSYGVAFGTVVPAIYATTELIRTFLPEVRIKSQPTVGYPICSGVCGVAALVAALVFPAYCFPLLWIAPVLILDRYNYGRSFPSFMRDFEKGSARNLVAALISGFICGILWEGWNFWSISKWIYTVPFFENMKVFEMPLAGYLGFPLFALGTMSFVYLIQTRKLSSLCTVTAATAALALSLITFAMIDRYTVFSYTAPVGELSFIDEATREALTASGVRTSFGIDPVTLDGRVKTALALMHLKGLGYKNYLLLEAHGINSVYALSVRDEASISHILGEPNLRRIRVYLKAARQAQGT